MCSKDNSGERCRTSSDTYWEGGERLLGATKWRWKPRHSSQYFLTQSWQEMMVTGLHMSEEGNTGFPLSFSFRGGRTGSYLFSYVVIFLKLFSFQAAFFLILWLQSESFQNFSCVCFLCLLPSPDYQFL